MTCGSLTRHVAPLANPPRFVCLYSFLTGFSRQILGAFYCSKWVMRGTVGNLEKSTFQQYTVCTNWSSDEKVMAPESQGIGAVFSPFFDEDSGQTREATGEPRVVSYSWSCSLSYVPRLTDQLVVSQKESSREGSCPGGKTRQIFSAFSLFFICVHAHG